MQATPHGSCPSLCLQVADARVGDTITLKKSPAQEALPGYTEAMPMVFCGLFPTGAPMHGSLPLGSAQCMGEARC